MRSSRFSFGLSASSFLCTVVFACALVACGGSPEVVNGGNGFGGGPGDGNGQAGKGNAGTSFDFGGGSQMGDAGSMDVPEAGPGCGDGIVNQKSEECDDGNTLPGDGCSGACTKEDYSECPPEGGECMSTIKCGDGVIEASEACDDGNADDGDGCSSDCLIKDPNYDCAVVAQMCINLNVCGDSKVTGEENCDDGNHVAKDGCSADCSTVEDGYICGKPGPGSCRKIVIPVCGDGVLDSGEDCDDGNTATAVDGCTATCTVDAGWVCPTAGSACLQKVCGDGIRTPDEQCDDGNLVAGDGCSLIAGVCSVETGITVGWVCPQAGKPCLPKCGDGKINGYEQCEDGNAKSGDGCSSACRLEPGFVCPTKGALCTKAICGKNGVEADEGCDDGNTVYGDGCSGQCQNEPTFNTDGSAKIVCGDGIHAAGEACDDGNKNSGDGCSASCVVETGFTCNDAVSTPDFIDIKVRYHDFLAKGDTTPSCFQANAPTPCGHPDFEDKNGGYLGLVGAPCTNTNQGSCGVLDTDGKPSLVITNSDRVYSTASFAQWYRDVAGVNKGIDGSIRMARQGVTGASYAFDSTAFFPLDGNTDGYGNYSTSGHDFGFTTELDYFFQYNGGEELTFRGDDDVWVFINHKLAVDIGGIHGASWGRVTLGDEASACSVHEQGSLPTCTPTINTAADSRFGLVKGGIYQISFFQAERHTNASNFRLTLQNFLPTHSQCIPNCGDGKVVIGEVCDDGTAQNTGDYGHCNATCSGRNFCGDGLKNGPEKCDNGVNLGAYNDTSGCAAGCVAPPRCGDKVVDFTFKEECDDGTAANTGAYGGCSATCKLGPFCGDGHLDSPQETCDNGSANGGYGKACGYDCQPGARCGDGIKNGTEQCDLGDGKNVGGYGGCKSNCALDARCGDSKVQTGEDCDDGKNTGGYGKCAPGCKYGPRCGDGIKNGSEQCDDGVNDGSYGKCAKDCQFGPRCGDKVVQSPETCDEGSNNGKGDCSGSCTLQITK
jgi:fibro-slime domain-containing protein